MEDVDLNLDDMIAKVNSDLVGKFVNIASRCAGFIGKRFDGKLASVDQLYARASEIRSVGKKIPNGDWSAEDPAALQASRGTSGSPSTPRVISTGSRATRSLGVDLISLHNVARDQERFIDLFGERVLPELRRSSGAAR